MDRYIFFCDCGSLNHHFILEHDKDFQDYVYFYFSLNKLSFFKRLKASIKYVLGQMPGEMYGEVILNKKSAFKLQNYLNIYLRENSFNVPN
jgi:hypothetical protein